MRPIERTSRGRHQLDHENRIQTLERRIPVDFPHWYGQAFNEEINVNNEGGFFSYVFPDECLDPDPVACEEEFVTDGDYILFPTGHNGPYHCYIDVALTGGFSNVDNPYVPVDLGVRSPSRRFCMAVFEEIWRDNAPYGFITTKAWAAQGEWMPPDSEDGLSDGRVWWLYVVGTGAGIFDTDRDRRALRFGWTWNKTADISFGGSVAIAIDPPDLPLPGGNGSTANCSL